MGNDKSTHEYMKRHYIIQPATKNDLPAMTFILQSLHYPWHPSALETCFHENYLAWIIKHRTIVAGFLIVKTTASHWEIILIAIAPAFQRQGLATKLLQFLQETTKSLQLDVRKSNHIAILLYKKCGFVQVGIRKEYYTDGKKKEDALLFDWIKAKPAAQ